MLSKACEYAIKAVLHITHISKTGGRVSIKDIAKAIDSPEAFTGKIMQQLSKSNIVKSMKGPSGGFWIEESESSKINLKTIVEIIDGNALYTKCGIGLEQCNDHHPCPIHDDYAMVRKAIIQLHSKISLEDLANKLEGKAKLK